MPPFSVLGAEILFLVEEQALIAAGRGDAVRV